VGLKACAQRSSAIVGACVRGQRDRGDAAARPGVDSSNAPNELVAVDLREADVADENVWSDRGHHLERFAGGTGGADRGMVLFEQSPENLSVIGIILD
jgi:hypothetical protein